jgi:cytochrome c oxidase cbb3-type subunit 3
MKPAVLIFCCTLGVLMGCRRETRNFRNGGPNTYSREPSASYGESATGPRAGMEQNAYALSQGKQLYINFNCVGCHSNGGGDIGPPLMDNKWLYGASPADIESSILDGRPNGMPAFRGRISESQVRQLAAYVRSLSGQAREQAAPSRAEHYKTTGPENSMDRQTPEKAKSPTQ